MNDTNEKQTIDFWKKFQKIKYNMHKASLEDVKDTILEDLSDEYLSENADASIKALQELRKKYDVDIIDTELHTQYANYIQNALLAVQTNAEQ